MTPGDYLMFMDKMAQDETTKEQAERAVGGSLYCVSAIQDGGHIGMARLIGDGAIFWCIVDVFVLPEYQGKGIGRTLVEKLIAYIKENGPKGYHSLFLMCAQGKEGFYEKLGFAQRPHKWEGAGMEMEIENK